MSGMSKAKDSIALQVTLVDGAATVTNIAVSGIATEDTIVFVGHYSTKAAIATLVDLTSETSITSAGNIQLDTTATTSDLLQVFWLDNSA